MENTVKVLVVLDFINNNSGVSSVVMNYYANMDNEKVKIDFLLYENPEESILEYLSSKSSKVYVSGQPTKLGIYEYQKTIKAFFKANKEKYQIVHVHIPNVAFVVLKYAKKYGVKTRIIHSHNSRGADGKIKKIRNFILNKWGVFYANKYFACSEFAGQYLYGKRYFQKIEIINNAIDLKKFEYNPINKIKIREELGIRNELVIGHVGRFIEQKNHEFLIQIAKRLKIRNIEFKLLLLGGGELQPKIREKVEGLGLEKNIHFIGVVGDVKPYMDAMDIFLLPSIYEGLPCVCVEAQANGLPCLISSNVTKEVCLSPTSYFLEILNADIWVEEIIKQYITQKIEREQHRNNDSMLVDYDITIQARGLEEKYLSYGKSANFNVDL